MMAANRLAFAEIDGFIGPLGVSNGAACRAAFAGG